MKKQLLLLLPLCLAAASMNAETKRVAFPGAEGYGRYAWGGRGGAVYHVTSLADDGSKGTLRWACNQKGARTIVFDVAGTIHLTSQLSIKNDSITIAGQTAPGAGICVADFPFAISCNEAIVRYIRVRLGNLNVDKHEGDGFGSCEKDNIIIDHCSISWSVDECLSVYGGYKNTVQWCIVAQSMRDSGHSKGTHGYGGIWGGSGASFLYNLVCHHDSRTPRFGTRPRTETHELVDMRNNVIYNWAGNGCYGGEGMNVNIVNNYYKAGPATKTKGTTLQERISALSIRMSSSKGEADSLWHKWGDYYVDGNFFPYSERVTRDNWTYGIYNQINNASVVNTFTQATRDTMRLAEPLPFPATTTFTAQTAYDKVLQYAGCIKIRLKGSVLERDSYDDIMVSDTKNGTATYGNSGKMPGIIDTQADCLAPGASSPWPDLTATSAEVSRFSTDTDGDGIPDYYEDLYALDLSNPKDGNAYTLSKEYTNLEVYLNNLVQNKITKYCVADGEVLGDEVGYYTTGIAPIEAEVPSVQDYVYDVCGRCVASSQTWSKVRASLPRGIYLVNGKKIIINQ